MGALRRNLEKYGKIASIPPIIDNPALLYPSDNHLMQRPWCIEPSLPWHMTPNNNLIPAP